MARGSLIQWTEDTLNAVLGCFMCSLGCFNCYALFEVWRMSHNPNFGMSGDNPYVGLVEKNPNTGKLNWTGRIRFVPSRLYSVLRTRKSTLFFVNSLSDLFYERLPANIIQEHFRVFTLAYWHQFQVLTKRSERLRKLAQDIEWPDNVWMGVSVERPATLYRIADLGQTRARIKFVSFEPWLSETRMFAEVCPNLRDVLKTGRLDWAIIGGESSKAKDTARPMRLEDVRYIMQECRSVGVRVFLKQLGTRWAIESGTYGKNGLEGKRATEVNSGGNPDFWPAEFRDAQVQEYPDIEWRAWARPEHSMAAPSVNKTDWKEWATPEMEEAGNPKHTVFSLRPSQHRPATAPTTTLF